MPLGPDLIFTLFNILYIIFILVTFSTYNYHLYLMFIFIYKHLYFYFIYLVIKHANMYLPIQPINLNLYQDQ